MNLQTFAALYSLKKMFANCKQFVCNLQTYIVCGGNLNNWLFAFRKQYMYAIYKESLYYFYNQSMFANNITYNIWMQFANKVCTTFPINFCLEKSHFTINIWMQFANKVCTPFPFISCLKLDLLPTIFVWNRATKFVPLHYLIIVSN